MADNHDSDSLSYYGGLENSSPKHTIILPENDNDKNSHINLNDLNDNYINFTNELSSILSEIENQNSDAIICGDFNLNLLRINEKETVCDYFEIICSKSFFPKIALPTRFSLRNGTLIDNIFCKISDTTLNTPSGIPLKTFSDHNPYISTFKIPDVKDKYIKYPLQKSKCAARLQLAYLSVQHT